jgi:RNA polymerase sigma-70 factor (ECF subfamily)
MKPNPPWALERYRSWLRLQVRQLRFDPRLRTRFDESDLVQDALLKAHENLASFRGTSEAALVRWLEEILTNVLTDALRRERAQKRDVALEQSLHAAVAESSARLEKFLQADQSSPSQRVEHREELLLLAEALDQLPDDQREVVLRRDLRGESVEHIAREMQRSETAVAGLLFRGRRRLRELLTQPDSSPG